MSIVHTKIPEVIQLEPQVFADDRGFFFEAYNHQKFVQQTGIVANFVQDNHSYSKQNVLRGCTTKSNNPKVNSFVVLLVPSLT